MTVLAAHTWASNAELIADVAALGYLRPSDVVLDPTFGSGNWWKKWAPYVLIAHDKFKLDGVDFRCLPELDGTIDAVAFDPPYMCVSLDTEMLTQRGWVQHADVQPSDLALTFNTATGMAEWQPVLEVKTYPAPATLVSLEGQAHSSLSTANHRWPVRRRRRDGLPLWEFATTERYSVDDCVPLSAPLADMPQDPKWSDALVEVTAWFWTEGHIERLRDGQPGGYANIVQKYEARDRCDRIRSALFRLFGPSVDRFPRVGRTTDGVPRWRETRDGHNATFWLSADAGRLLQDLAPGRVPTYEFLLSLTQSQLDLFIEASLLADGYVGPTRTTLGQKNRAAAEAFQFACILAGHATSLTSTPHPLGYRMWTVRMRRRHHFKLSRQTRTEVAGEAVWCPTTLNGTWLARRNGTAYFTGNSAGGRTTTTMPDFYKAYGLTEAASTPTKVQRDINAGISEAHRVLKPRGVLLVKVQDYISSGRLWLGLFHTTTHLLALDFEVVDRFEHVAKAPRPQPVRTRQDGTPVRQHHARRNHSTLLVCRRGR